jgi:rfaE bifunctional protein kinase chain/domain
MNSKRLETLLAQISQLRFAVIGDYALDFYFQFNPSTQEISIETGKEVQHASQTRTSLGGAGNVAKNLAYLGVQVDAYGLRGDDIFGREIVHLAQELNINTEFLKAKAEIDTPTYSKPMQSGIEQNRLDFGTRNLHFQNHGLEAIHELAIRMGNYDWIIINEQFHTPLLNQATLEFLQKFTNERVLADLRSLGPFANEVILKVNEAEFNKIITKHADLETSIKSWVMQRGKPVLLTLGDKGMIYASSSEFHWEKAIPAQGPIDTVGAGDMVVAAFSAARAAGSSIEEACELASLAVHVSIHKIGETGSANALEIIKTYHATRN